MRMRGHACQWGKKTRKAASWSVRPTTRWVIIQRSSCDVGPYLVMFGCRGLTVEEQDEYPPKHCVRSEVRLAGKGSLQPSARRLVLISPGRVFPLSSSFCPLSSSSPFPGPLRLSVPSGPEIGTRVSKTPDLFSYSAYNRRLLRRCINRWRPPQPQRIATTCVAF